MLKKFIRNLSGLAQKINGNESPKATEPSDQKSDEPVAEERIVEPMPDEERIPAASTNSILNNAIDNRDQAVRMIVDSFRRATGSKSNEFADLTVIVPYTETTFDPLNHAWADDQFLTDLRRELDNALLSAVGSRDIKLKFLRLADVQKDSCREIIPDALYVCWKKLRAKQNNPGAVAGRLTIINGTGSLMQESYLVDSSVKSVYHIGRGEVVRLSGNIRRNDIVVCEAETNPELAEYNARVSSNHADLVARSGRLYLRAAAGGCRALGGSVTKLIRNDEIIELNDTSSMMPVNDGDMIELGKNLTLLFSAL